MAKRRPAPRAAAAVPELLDELLALGAPPTDRKGLLEWAGACSAALLVAVVRDDELDADERVARALPLYDQVARLHDAWAALHH